jgi:2,3-bisphosphoglycerate-dependent phosphoglycerate mutase
LQGSRISKIVDPEKLFYPKKTLNLSQKQKMAQLTLIRHGQSVYNLENRFTGTLDVALTPLGEAEAKIAGGKLKAFRYTFAYTSTLIRAQETLRIILEEIAQTSLPIICNAALNERMYGNLQGLNKAETAAKYGDEQVDIWRRSYAVCPPEGESLEDTFNRAVPYYQSEIEPKLRAGNNILIVAHGNSLRALKMYLEHISTTEIAHVNIPTGMPIIYNFDKNLKIIDVNYL